MIPSSPFSIAAIGAALPASGQNVAEAGADLGLSRGEISMFSRLFGLDNLPYDAATRTDDLLLAAIDDVAAAAPDVFGRVTHMVHCHTVPASRPPECDARLGLPAHVETMSLTMNHCATGLSALALAENWLEADNAVLVVIGEAAFHRRIRLIRDTTIMSEGAAAVLLTRTPGPWSVRGIHTSHAGATAISRGHPREDMLLDTTYSNFVRDHIAASLAHFDTPLEDIALILPHNVNTISWLKLAGEMGLPPGRLYLGNVGRIGHCFGADPFLNALSARDEGLLRPGDTALMVSVGMGMSAASALIEFQSVPVTPTSREVFQCP